MKKLVLFSVLFTSLAGCGGHRKNAAAPGPLKIKALEKAMPDDAQKALETMFRRLVGYRRAEKACSAKLKAVRADCGRQLQNLHEELAETLNPK